MRSICITTTYIKQGPGFLCIKYILLYKQVFRRRKKVENRKYCSEKNLSAHFPRFFPILYPSKFLIFISHYGSSHDIIIIINYVLHSSLYQQIFQYLLKANTNIVPLINGVIQQTNNNNASLKTSINYRPVFAISLQKHNEQQNDN